MDLLNLDFQDSKTEFPDDGGLDFSSFLEPKSSATDPALASGPQPTQILGSSVNNSIPASVKEEDTGNIRASLSRALNHNNINFPIPEEEEGIEKNEFPQHDFSREEERASSLSNTPGVARSRKNTISSPPLQPIDRKRRDNMNDKIYELFDVIPRHLFEDTRDKSFGTKDGKPNKGQILCKSVEYINYLQAQIDEKNRKEVELSIRLRNLEIANKIPPYQRLNLLHTSAEIGLAKIGVGPLADQEHQEQAQAQAQASASASQPAQSASSNSDFTPPNLKV